MIALINMVISIVNKRESLQLFIWLVLRKELVSKRVSLNYAFINQAIVEGRHRLCIHLPGQSAKHITSY